MKTAFQTGPGFYAADTCKSNKDVAAGDLRIYCIRMEAYDITGSPEDPGNEIKFELVFAKAEHDPRIAMALLKLGKAIEANKETLESML